VTTNRSSEEFEMRKAIDAWGRQRWASARVVHELVVNSERRIDMAFIGPDYLVGVEIKSSKDTLDRLSDQMKVFRRHIPLVILAVAPKWRAGLCIGGVDVFEVDPSAEFPVRGYSYYRQDLSVTVPLLGLLWAQELRNAAIRLGINSSAKATMIHNIATIAQNATGKEIIREVCTELRARDAFPKSKGHPPSDPPIGKAYRHPSAAPQEAML
jgi:hypothetical protein